VIIAGCDPSSKKMAVVVDSDPPTTHVWKMKPVAKFSTANLISVHEWIVEEFADHEPGHIVFEWGLAGRDIRATMVQAYTSGAAQAAFMTIGWTVSLVNVSTWKSTVVGNGRASKDDVQQFVSSEWPECDFQGDADLADASAIALWGRQTYGAGAAGSDERGAELRSTG